MNRNTSALDESLQYFPGGVNSPVRAFKAVGGNPLFISKGYGSKIRDIEGRDFIDYVGSWGPLILGHAEKGVIDAVTNTIRSGMSFGAPTLAETELAGLIREAFPIMQKMRFVNSGTEAAMSAIRLARGFTGKNIIVKFDGAYHGHADSLLVAAGSGVATQAIPGCPGIPEAVASLTVVIPFNDELSVEKVFARHGNDIAAMILEPVCGNIGTVTPRPGYLAYLREITRKYDSCLIFDEVMTGFRACFGGIDTLEGVIPDLCCLGKIVGGGLPLAVYGGRREIMEKVAPDGPVYQAGTLSGNPVAVSAGIATLKHLKETNNFYKRLGDSVSNLTDGLEQIAHTHNVECVINRFGSMFTVFFAPGPVYDYQSAKKSDLDLFARWFHGMLDRGIYLPPSQFESLFVSSAHTQADIDKTLSAAKEVMSSFNPIYR